MKLSVKARIVAAMITLVAVNTANAAISWNSFAAVASHNADASHALGLARDAERVSARLTQFVSDSRGVAFTLSRSHTPEDLSGSYGELQGSEAGVDAALRLLASGDAQQSARALSQWNELRTTTYAWLNREAESAGSSFRLTKDGGGRYRASVGTNIHETSHTASLSDEEFSRVVRNASEALTGNTLRVVGTQAEMAAAEAARREAAVRSGAVRSILMLAALGLVVAVVAATWLYRSIALPLSRARDFADTVASGHLEASFAHHRTDEIGVLTHAVEDMKNAVVRRMATMREMAGAVLVTAEDVRIEAVAAGAPAVVHGADVLLSLSSQMLED